MSQSMGYRHPDAASVAGQVLYAFRRGAGLEQATAHAERLALQSRGRSTFEAEKFEVLCSAIDALEAQRPEAIRAGIYLLEHLANQSIDALANSQTA